jgi:hypothetical protein
MIGITGWYSIFPYFFAVLVAMAAAAAATRRLPISGGDAVLALAGLLGWALVATTATNPNGKPPGLDYVITITLLISTAVIGIVVTSSVGWTHRTAGEPSALD